MLGLLISTKLAYLPSVVSSRLLALQSPVILLASASSNLLDFCKLLLVITCATSIKSPGAKFL
jgi:hypothetical protein